jgi:DNA-binding NarL/FixJ family response regulator
LTDPSGKIRVAVCDDHGLFRRGVVEMLSFADDMEVVGEASDHDGAVELVRKRGPDVVLLDLEMPGMGPTRRCSACSRSHRTPRRAVIAPTRQACVGASPEGPIQPR